MKRPKEMTDCPMCGAKNTVSLIIKKIERMSKLANKPLKINWWNYICSKCNGGFSTDESDTISLESLKS